MGHPPRSLIAPGNLFACNLNQTGAPAPARIRGTSPVETRTLSPAPTHPKGHPTRETAISPRPPRSRHQQSPAPTPRTPLFTPISSRPGAPLLIPKANATRLPSALHPTVTQRVRINLYRRGPSNRTPPSKALRGDVPPCSHEATNQLDYLEHTGSTQFSLQTTPGTSSPIHPLTALGNSPSKHHPILPTIHAAPSASRTTAHNRHTRRNLHTPPHQSPLARRDNCTRVIPTTTSPSKPVLSLTPPDVPHRQTTHPKTDRQAPITLTRVTIAPTPQTRRRRHAHPHARAPPTARSPTSSRTPPRTTPRTVHPTPPPNHTGPTPARVSPPRGPSHPTPSSTPRSPRPP